MTITMGHTHGPSPAPTKSDVERRASHNLGRLQGKESILTSTISIFVDENQPKIPDGGWGWLVVIGSLFINLVSDGITCCFGLLYIDFLNEFGASKSATSWIGSLYVAVPLVGGPIGSALVDKYGCKKMTIVGALISTTGFILSTYSRNIVVMYLTFGFLGGIGLALCYVTAVVAIAFWFDKNRTLALGLAAAGCGFGTVIYSPLITALSLAYSWRGTVLILAGLFANMIVCGLLQRDPKWILQQEKRRLEEEKQEKYGQQSTMLQIRDSSVEIQQKKNLFRSVGHLPTYSDNNKERSFKGNKGHPDPFLEKPKEDNHPTNGVLMPLMNVSHRVKTQSSGHLQFGYLANMQLHKRKSFQQLSRNKITASCPNVWESQIQGVDDKNPKTGKKQFSNIMETIRQIIDFSMFGDLHFLLVSIATIIMCICFAVPFVYLADHMKTLGYDDYSTSFTISVIGATNIVGMVIVGFLGTKMDVATLYAICLILSGICCAVMMLFSHSHVILIIASGAFGLFYASQHSLTPAIVALLVPLDKFSMAYGLSLLCQGIGKLTGPPLAGLLFDITQSYSQSFYQAAIWIIVAGVLIGVIPYTKDRKLFSR